MRPDQFIGWTLLQSTAVTGITSTRVWYGLRPNGDTLPAINFYDVGGPGRFNGLNRPVFSINCRAATAGAARALADTVLSLFIGDDGKYGDGNGFAAARVSLVNDGGLIPEDDAYNVPIDVRVISTI
jgi:hypothetical protein